MQSQPLHKYLSHASYCIYDFCKPLMCYTMTFHAAALSKWLLKGLVDSQQNPVIWQTSSEQAKSVPVNGVSIFRWVILETVRTKKIVRNNELSALIRGCL